MTKPRVLIPVTNPLGGIRTYMLYNLKRLHEEGYRFTFLSKAGAAFDGFKKDLLQWERTDFIESPKGAGAKEVFFTLRKTLKENRFAMIHSQGLRAGVETAAANYFKRIPHLITLHDVIVPGNEIQGKYIGLKKTAIGFLARQASVIIPVSEDCKQNHLENFPSWRRGPAQIETIHNCIDVESLLQAQSALAGDQRQRFREEHGIEPNIILGGFFGRFMPQKGFDLLLEALHILIQRGYGDRFRLIATKDLSGYLKETIRDAEKDPQISRMIRFIDPVPEIAPVLSQMDVLVMPSRWEAFSLLVMEAMVLGIPVIATNCIGLREVLEDSPSLVAESGHADSLAERLIEFIESPTTQKALDFAPTAARRFDIRVATEKLLNVYRRFC